MESSTFTGGEHDRFIDFNSIDRTLHNNISLDFSKCHVYGC